MSSVHPFSKRCDKSEIDLFRVPPTQQSLERGRWIDYAPLSSVENPDSAITYLIAGTDEYVDLSKTILTVRGEITKGDGTKLTGGGQTDVAPVNNFLHSLFRQVDVYLNGKQVTPAWVHTHTALTSKLSSTMTHQQRNLNLLLPCTIKIQQQRWMMPGLYRN